MSFHSACHVDIIYFLKLARLYGSVSSRRHNARIRRACRDHCTLSSERNKRTFEKVGKTTKADISERRARERGTWERFHRNRAGPVPCWRTEARRNRTDIRVLARARVSGRSCVRTRFSRATQLSKPAATRGVLCDFYTVKSFWDGSVDRFGLTIFLTRVIKVGFSFLSVLSEIINSHIFHTHTSRLISHTFTRIPKVSSLARRESPSLDSIKR